MKNPTAVLLFLALMFPLNAGATFTTNWQEQWNGYGINTYENGWWDLRPMVSKDSNETHSSFVLSEGMLRKDFRLNTTILPKQQLREGTAPSPWETGWIVFGYQPNGSFKYLILKPNGYGVELGEFLAGEGQNFLYTSDVGALDFPIGSPMDIQLSARRGVIRAVVNGNEVMRYRMSSKDRLGTSGRFGWYTEDADVMFQDPVVSN